MKFLLLILPILALSYPIVDPGGGVPFIQKGSLISSDGAAVGEFSGCADAQIIEWDSAEANGFKCVDKDDPFPLLGKGTLYTSDGTANGEFPACSNGQTIEWDSTVPFGFKCTAFPSSGANTSLSNLTSPTSINQNLLPNGSRSLGSSSSPWALGYFIDMFFSDGALNDRTLHISGGNGGFSNVGELFGSRIIGNGTNSQVRGSLGVGTRVLNNQNPTGKLVLFTGSNTSGASGDIVIKTGTGGTIDGNIEIDANVVNLNSTMMKQGRDPEDPQDLATKAYVDAAGAAPRIAYIYDAQIVGTDGGTATAGETQRDINTLIGGSGFVTLGAVDVVASGEIGINSFILQPGTYHIVFSAPAYNVNRHQVVLRSISGSTFSPVRGTSSFTGSGATTRSEGEALLTFTQVTEVGLFHNIQTSRGGNGFGVSSGFGTEIYAKARVQKVN